MYTPGREANDLEVAAVTGGWFCEFARNRAENAAILQKAMAFCELRVRAIARKSPLVGPITAGGAMQGKRRGKIPPGFLRPNRRRKSLCDKELRPNR